MKEKLKHLTVYKAVRPSECPLGITSGMMLIVAIALILVGIFVLLSGNSEGVIYFFPGGLLLIILPFILRNEKLRRWCRKIRFAQFSSEDFLRLEEEVKHTPARYDAFHMLEEYLFIPQAGVLLRYDEILEIIAIVHKTNLITQGVTLRFVCPDIPYDAMLPKWKSYLNYPAAFEREFNAKRSPSHPVSIRQKTDHDIHVPHISA